MGKTITIGNDTFTYVDNGKYVEIYGYSHKDGALKFVEESDGKSYFHIHIPETIKGLPVLQVDRLSLNVDYKHHYRHNGYDVVKIHLPENTAFLGLKSIRIDSYSVFVPNYTKEYYPRKKQMLMAHEGAFYFYGKQTSATTCEIITIVGAHDSNGDWVWSDGLKDRDSVEEIVVPSRIGEYSVSEICADSTDALPKKLKEIHISEGVEVIGDGCFSKLPLLTDVYLPESMKRIGAKAFSFYECDRSIEKVPTLHVHYYDVMPSVGEEAFLRHADKEHYEDHGDWGDMYAGKTHYNYEVVYDKR